MTTQIHTPVLKEAVFELLSPVLGHGAIYVDATIGAGGHAKYLIEELSQHKIFPRIIGIDQDTKILDQAQKTLKDCENNITLIHGNFRDIDTLLLNKNISGVDAILADIGVSSLQIDTDSRGFSFSKDAPLDMRMDQSNQLTAELIIKTWNESKIAQILWDYGEERQARRIAKAICVNRKNINSTVDLAAVIQQTIPQKYNKINPATKTFQALRIAVNDELNALEDFIQIAPKLLKSNGRLAIISFHSLEDRLVKKSFIDLAKNENYKVVTKHPVAATSKEINLNRRARSAKLRVLERGN